MARGECLYKKKEIFLCNIREKYFINIWSCVSNFLDAEEIHFLRFFGIESLIKVTTLVFILTCDRSRIRLFENYVLIRDYCLTQSLNEKEARDILTPRTWAQQDVRYVIFLASGSGSRLLSHVLPVANAGVSLGRSTRMRMIRAARIIPLCYLYFTQ